MVEYLARVRDPEDDLAATTDLGFDQFRADSGCIVVGGDPVDGGRALEGEGGWLARGRDDKLVLPEIAGAAQTVEVDAASDEWLDGAIAFDNFGGQDFVPLPGQPGLLCRRCRERHIALLPWSNELARHRPRQRVEGHPEILNNVVRAHLPMLNRRLRDVDHELKRTSILTKHPLCSRVRLAPPQVHVIMQGLPELESVPKLRDREPSDRLFLDAFEVATHRITLCPQAATLRRDAVIAVRLHK